ncbi:styrene monooxygenase/indole monooxygenase family protein [Streptomyces sp. NPDC049577]|uniref:styrene monooxygenase/indole monooxygenase family protein n=1 Tax=Streptomyces sp. NPDC049577 TaxID=3155153 RepID=UPI003428FBC7
MRRIAIVGAGQAGLQLALGLRAAGYEVTVVSARAPEELRTGRVMSTQLMYGPALALERAAGLNLWDGAVPRIDGVCLATVSPPGSVVRTITAPLDAPAQSVDQRVKTARWLELLSERGGRVEYRSLAPEELAPLAAAHDLTVVATGAGPLSRIFGRDERHSPFDGPRRVVACVYVHGMAPYQQLPPSCLRMCSFPEIGEFFVLPALTGSGACHILLWEGVPGGPLDCWRETGSDPGALLARSRELLATYAPWEAALLSGAEPTDAGAGLAGAVSPIVRHPVAEVGDGLHVLGMADAVVLNDPISGQGANNAARSAAHYLASILQRGDAAFDRAWMHEAFAAYWEHARHVNAFTNLLLSPLPEHVRRLLTAAAEHPDIAHRYVNGFADPAGYREWLMDADRAEAVLAAVGVAGG